MSLRAKAFEDRTQGKSPLQPVHHDASPPTLAATPAPLSAAPAPRTDPAHFAATITAATYIRPTTHNLPTASSDHRHNRIDDCRSTCRNILASVVLLASHQSHGAFPPPRRTFSHTLRPHRTRSRAAGNHLRSGACYLRNHEACARG